MNSVLLLNWREATMKPHFNKYCQYSCIQPFDLHDMMIFTTSVIYYTWNCSNDIITWFLKITCCRVCLRYSLHFSEEVKVLAYSLFGHYLQEHNETIFLITAQISILWSTINIPPTGAGYFFKVYIVTYLEQFFTEVGCLKISTRNSGVTYWTLHHPSPFSLEHVKFVSAMAPAPLLHIPEKVQTLWTWDRKQQTHTPGLYNIWNTKIFVPFSNILLPNCSCVAVS